MSASLLLLRRVLYALMTRCAFVLWCMTLHRVHCDADIVTDLHCTISMRSQQESKQVHTSMVCTV